MLQRIVNEIQPYERRLPTDVVLVMEDYYRINQTRNAVEKYVNDKLRNFEVNYYQNLTNNIVLRLLDDLEPMLNSKYINYDFITEHFQNTLTDPRFILADRAVPDFLQEFWKEMPVDPLDYLKENIWLGYYGVHDGGNGILIKTFDDDNLLHIEENNDFYVGLGRTYLLGCNTYPYDHDMEEIQIFPLYAEILR